MISWHPIMSWSFAINTYCKLFCLYEHLFLFLLYLRGQKPFLSSLKIGWVKIALRSSVWSCYSGNLFAILQAEVELGIYMPFHQWVDTKTGYHEGKMKIYYLEKKEKKELWKGFFISVFWCDGMHDIIIKVLFINIWITF